MNIKKKIILTSIMILFVFSSFSLASAAEGWELEETDNLYYYVEVKEDGVILAKGIVSFIVVDITASTIRFSITADFSGSSAITYRDEFENRDNTDIIGSLVGFGFFSSFYPHIFIKEDFMDTRASFWQDIVDSYNVLPNYTVEADLQDSEWYYILEHDVSDYLQTRTMKYTAGGILKSYKLRHVNTDGTLEQEFFIEKSILPFKVPIAVSNFYVYIAAGALGLVLILIFSSIFRKKKK